MKLVDFGYHFGTQRPYAVQLPETAAEAERTFACGPMSCRGVTGEGCARRHLEQAQSTASSAMGPCRICPAGAARAELLGIDIRRAHGRGHGRNTIHGWQPQHTALPDIDWALPRPVAAMNLREQQDAIVDCIRAAGGTVQRASLRRVGFTPWALNNNLPRLERSGRLVRVRRGVYTLGLAERCRGAGAGVEVDL